MPTSSCRPGAGTRTPGRTGRARGPGRIRPDAHVELRLAVDGDVGLAGAFVEVDFATMDQARLRAKVARHHRYCDEAIWWDRHPCCPALLLVTTSEARVNRFLAAAEKDRPRPSPYEQEHPAHYHELVAACAAVSSPEAVVVAPVWRASVGDAPSHPVPAAHARGAPVPPGGRPGPGGVASGGRPAPPGRRREPRPGHHSPRRCSRRRGGRRRRALRARRRGRRRAVGRRAPRLGRRHARLVGASQVRRRRAPPAALVAAWRALYRQCWLAQADMLVAQREAIRLSDPRLRRAAAALAAGHLFADYTLEPTSPIDGQQMVADALAHHDSRREQAVTAELHALPLHHRLRVARCDLEAAYDARHLYVCERCALPYNVERDPHEQGPLAMTCRCCGGSLVPAAEAPDLPPPLEDSLARVADRSEQLGSRPRPTRDRTVDRSPPFDGGLPGGTTTAPRCPSRSGDYPAIREVEQVGKRPLPREWGSTTARSPAVREVHPAGSRPVPPMPGPLVPVSITAREVTTSGAVDRHAK